ncbi:MAG: 3-deoxy-D-manno-octulosonic-acid transferase [Acidobacteriota bacterium]|jgi:3-deoxy-D-manno-octulosonic-acid transferase|nr:3-deoxy-D-manno-octulosonic-acid transferase [Acidobacteriota bacterium]
MFVVYEVVLYLVFVLALPFFLLLGVLRGKYLENFAERMGFYRSHDRNHDLWLHAVSVGETLAARPVVDEIRRLRPRTSLVITTTTVTGQAQARRLFPDATVTYFPFDFAFTVQRFLAHHRPRVFATMETEIWPNVTRLARARGLKLLLANGRISDRSFPRYRAFRFVLAPILRNYTRILAREETDRARFIAIGAPAEIVETSGNVKFDYVPDESPLAIAPQLESLIAGRKVLILGSTTEGEDEALLPELERFLKERNAFAIVAPRKAERFEFVASLLTTTEIAFVRRSEMSMGAGALAGPAGESPAATPPSLLLLDSFGELAKIYRYATAAFIGGSLGGTVGGHNPIEPAASGIAVSFGPSMHNFREIASVFLRNDAAVEVSSPAELFAFAGRMFDDEAARAAIGARAKETVLQNRGASELTARRIVELLS